MKTATCLFFRLVRPRHKLATAVAAFLAAASAAGAAPPREGILVPGQSLGGLRLGMTKQEVRGAWGTTGNRRGFFVCRANVNIPLSEKSASR